jgi:hypothetical protein
MAVIKPVADTGQIFQPKGAPGALRGLNKAFQNQLLAWLQRSSVARSSHCCSGIGLSSRLTLNPQGHTSSPA